MTRSRGSRCDVADGTAHATLHVDANDRGNSSVDAVGSAGNLGELVDRVLAQWLIERGLEPLPERTAYTTAELEALVEVLEPALTAFAERKAKQVHATESAEEPPPELPALPQAQRSLTIAAIRAFAICVGAAVHEPILALDPDDPWALHDAFEAGQAAGADFSLLRRALARAPSFARLLRSLVVPRGLEGQELPEMPDELEALGACGMATVCAPGDVRSRGAYAQRLRASARHEEVARLHRRTRDDAPYRASAWLPLLACQKPLEKVGQWHRLGGWGANTVGLVVGGIPQPFNPWSMRVDLHAANALRNVGLLGEAIVLRDNRLEGLHAEYPREVEILEGWRKQARFVAWAYAREGYFRGEDARVLEGFSRAEPNDGVDLGMFMESLVACGRSDEAVLAWAHLGRGRGLDTPFATTSAVRAMVAAGRFVDAFELARATRVRHVRRGHEAALDRSLRLLAHAPIEPFEAMVADHLRAGARRLAASAAREVADFVLGAADSAVIREALAPSPALAFAPGWLDGFAAVPGRAAIDELFAPPASGADPQAWADALVQRWPDVRFTEVREDDDAAAGRVTLYLFAQALSRYLATTTGAPSVIAGGLRTVASEALLALGHLRDDLADADLRALFGALESAAGVPASLLEPWLLRIEQTLRLEERTGGRLSSLASDCPALVDYLRGPEQIAVDTYQVAEWLREGTAEAAARALPRLERLVRAGGPGLAAAWAEAADRADAPDALDIALTAAFLAEGVDATPCVIAARRLFAIGGAADEVAYELLCRGMAGARSEAWRDEQLEQLRPLWEASSLGIPFGFSEGIPASVELLQRGDGAGAARILRWLLALDPKNGEGHRNFGIAYSMQGLIEPALTHFARASRDQDTQFASGTLFQAGHPALAMRVLDYASQWYTRAEQWITFGAIAYQVMDNPRTVLAYRNAWQLDPDAFDASNLNSYAGVLDEVGEYDMCERVARRLLEVGGDDPMWTSNGWNHLACAFIGQGRLEEAQANARKAIEQNTLPDNEPAFAETLRRASSGEPPAVPPPLPPPVPRHDAFVTLEAGEIKEVLARFAGDSDPEARLAVLRASRYRFGSDNYVDVTRTAIETAARLVEETNGTDVPLLALARSFALDVREQAGFPDDPMPALGDRTTRAAFYQEFRDRGGIIVGEPPVQDPPFVDREVCPGTAAPMASDYVRLLRALAAQRPADALASCGVDEAGFVAASEAWGQALRRDAELRTLLAIGLRS